MFPRRENSNSPTRRRVETLGIGVILAFTAFGSAKTVVAQGIGPVSCSAVKSVDTDDVVQLNKYMREAYSLFVQLSRSRNPNDPDVVYAAKLYQCYNYKLCLQRGRAGARINC
jgi:hypothetical protein